jgi:hypothetical protein
MMTNLKYRLALVLGRGWQQFLRSAEIFAYAIAGFPMAVKYLFAGAEPSPETAPAAYLHYVHGRAFWRSLFGPFKAIILAVLWPIAFVVAAVVFTLRNGAAVQRLNGTSSARQIVDQLRLGLGASIAPFWFYMFELYDPARQKQAKLYLNAHETIGPAFTLLQPADGSDRLADKVVFAARCVELGVRAVPVLFHVSQGQIVGADGGALGPQCDLFVKPRQGNGGHQSERWDFTGTGRYRNSAGLTLDWQSLTQVLTTQSLRQDFVVQPRLENNRALADISNGALATARVFTIRNELGQYEATNAAFRMAIGKNNVVDNFHQGGLATAVDLKTGQIGLATDMGIRPDVGWRDTHPVSGIRFAGRILPDWSEAVALACAAHAAFPQHVIVGWDVAMLEDGPCIIEGNAKPDLDIHQRVERRPLGDQRIATLIALNVKQAFAAADR